MTRAPETVIAAVRALYGETHHPASAANVFSVDALRGRYEREATRPTPVHGGAILGLLRTCAVLIAERDAALAEAGRQRLALRESARDLEDACERGDTSMREWCERLRKAMCAAAGEERDCGHWGCADFDGCRDEVSYGEQNDD